MFKEPHKYDSLLVGEWCIFFQLQKTKKKEEPNHQNRIIHLLHGIRARKT